MKKKPYLKRYNVPHFTDISAGPANSGGGGVGSHPGGIDRMAGGKVSKETGPSHPAYLPRGKSRR